MSNTSLKMRMIVSRASPKEMLQNTETTPKDTMRSSGKMLIHLIHSRYSNELTMLCSQSPIIGLRWVNTHFDKLYDGDPTSYIICQRVGRFVHSCGDVRTCN